MRQFQTLSDTSFDAQTGIFTISAAGENAFTPRLSIRREGEYLAISISFGALEIAMRPRYQEFAHALAHLRPVDGLQTTRQVGTGEAYIGLGLQSDGALLLRPTLVGDAHGYLVFNYALTAEAYKALSAWLSG
jgi:hypothetical protein